jgi:outer membrane protein assembly factor BamB
MPIVEPPDHSSADFRGAGGRRVLAFAKGRDPSAQMREIVVSRFLVSARIRSSCVSLCLILGAVILLGSTASAAPLTPGDLLAVVVMSPFPFPSYLVELSPDGSQLQWFPVPDVGDSFARDVVVDAQGRAYVFEGETRPYLDALDPASGLWTSRTAAGWGTTDAYGHGGVALAEGAVLVTNTWNQGLIRFDLPLGSATPDRPVIAADYRNIVNGLDGLVYALDSQGGQDGVAVDVLDPGSLARLRRITLPTGLSARAVAVDAAGRIFVASWQAAVYRLSPDGTLQASATFSAFGLFPRALIDIDVSAAGQVILGSSTGGVVITTTDFDHARTFAVNLGNYGVATYVGIVPTGNATPALRSTWGELKARFH